MNETDADIVINTGTVTAGADVTITSEDDITVGRLHRLGLRGSTKDNGGQAHRWRLYAERIACINCTLIPFFIAGIERNHQGDPAVLVNEIQALLNRAEEIMAVFSQHWRGAHVTRVFNGSTTAENAADVFGRLVDGGWVNVTRVKRDELIASLVDAWKEEPGNTYQAINRAITRAAHKFEWPGDGQEELEEQAGILLYQRPEVMQSLALLA